MKPWVLSVGLCAALLATPLWAQRGGGGGGHGGMGGGHGFGGGGHGFVGGAPHGGGFSGYHPGSGYGHPGYGGWHGNGYRSYGYRNRRYGYYPGWGYGYGGYGYYPSWGWYGDFDNDSYNDYPPDYYGPNEYAAAQPPPGYVYMTPQSSTATYADPGEVQKIQQEVDQLKALQAKRDQASESPAGQTGTVLVYRDGYTETINNYAIVGNTVWVLNQNSAKKVPLSELDLTATKRDNEERGTDFVVPKSSH